VGQLRNSNTTTELRHIAQGHYTGSRSFEMIIINNNRQSRFAFSKIEADQYRLGSLISAKAHCGTAVQNTSIITTCHSRVSLRRRSC